MRFFGEQSIRTRILLSVLGLTIIAVIVTAYLGVSSTLSAGESAQETSRVTLRQQAEEFLLQLTLEDAARNNQEFVHVIEDAADVASFTVNLFNNPTAFANENYWTVTDNMRFGDDGQYINDASDTSTVWVPSSSEVDDEFNRKLELMAYLDLVFIPILENNPNTVAIYIIGKEEYTRLYPNIDLPSILPPDFRATEDIFYLSGTPENNPEREIVWTPIYDDPAGQGLLVSAVAPIYMSDEFQGIIGLDVSLTNLTQAIEETALIADGYLFLIDQNGQAIALPHQGYQDILGREASDGETGADLAGSDVAETFNPVIAAMQAGETGFQSVMLDDEELFVTYTPLSSTGWSLATVVRADNMLQAADVLQDELQSTTQVLISQRIIPAGVIILIVAAIVSMALTNRLVVPIKQLAEAAKRIGEGQLDTPIPVSGNDEVGVLADSFRTTTEQLRTLIDNLEHRVADRTRDLEIAADVSTQITTVLDLDKLLPHIVEETRIGYGLYYASIFLYDEANNLLNLSAASSKSAANFEDEIQFELEQQGLVPKAARDRQTVLVNDISEVTDYFSHPLLTATRSEITIPMLVGQHLVGVLDLQSEQANFFDSDDVRTLTSLGTQIGVAVENARLFAEVQQARKEAEEANAVKSQFLANMSHELRTPLNAVLNFTAFVADGIMGPVNDAQVEALQQTITSGKHLLSLINDILDVTKIEAGLMDIFVQEVDINEILTSVASVGKGLVKDKPVSIITEIEEGLPQTFGDKRRLRQVFLNLVSNAAKFTPEGEITIKATYRDNRVHVSVQDTGVGMAETDQAIVFESFRQAKHDLPETLGTGLGMPISKFFVEIHQGKVWFTSALKVGTTFFVELPILTQEEAETINEAIHGRKM